ncbi:hypothetical protein K2173_024065 [Erythroxylum novogranatense]|uniref:DNA repair protein REV1 n=1 Tax=Erythroxylum novogranatense TaxID=1862640 RepID=A0AAV8TSM4_9ROSI|nr:hypothetical protein K2173_024065 [Erythroxylum novogranatense]
MSSKRSRSDSKSSKNSKGSKQKTLGMAWGANSLSASRSSFRSSPFSSFGSYMTEKNRKLRDQFDAEATRSSGSCKPIFRGVSIFVDGLTIPSSQELKGYMLNLGGRFENYFSRHRVTHIICSNLADTKVRNLRTFSCGLPVVKPSWISDSVAANRLLSWVPYQLDQHANNQPRLSAFFSQKSTQISDDLMVAASEENLNPSLKGGTPRSGNLSPSQVRNPTDNQLGESEPSIEEPSSSNSGRWSKTTISETSDSEIEDGNIIRKKLQASPHPSASISSYSLGKQTVKRSSNLALVGPPNQRHSTLEDSNFVENYFKSSRLHFIGTWRNRYRKRFPSLCNESRCRSSNLNDSDSSQKKKIIHVDMDCFFVSVVIRHHPELHDKPVAVCHSDNPKGTAEISSANYPARDYGVRAGIFVGDAKALCPHLIIFPYNFQAYEEVADQFYDILHKHCNKVQAVSCDEAFLDITDVEGVDAENLASTIRKEILDTTGCTASVGIAGNMLMARLATRAAKPDGQCYIAPEKVDEYLQELPIKTLPGIGHVLEEKLRKRNICTCGQLRLISKDTLQRDFGTKTGEMLWNYSRGLDSRLVGVIQESKSLGAEVNWGVRFKDLQDSHYFLSNLCKEVSLRLQGCGVHGRSFTLKIKKRKEGAGEPAKFMGCGDCENLSHSITVPIATDDNVVIERISKQLFGSFNLDVKDIRGVGLQVSKLENVDDLKQVRERNALRLWLTSASTAGEEQYNNKVGNKGMGEADVEVPSVNRNLGQFADQAGSSVGRNNNLSGGEASSSNASAPPPLSHLDVGVLQSLPSEVFSELNDIYGGKLVDFIAQRKGHSENCINSSPVASHVRDDGGGLHASDMSRLSSGLGEKNTGDEAQPVAVSEAGLCNQALDRVDLGVTDLMPSSLSQIDALVLHQLPEELRFDILQQLPAHRRQELTSNAGLGSSTEIPQGLLDVKSTDIKLPIDVVVDSNLWVGTPPMWVEKFKVSNCLLLNTLAETYYELGSNGNLSSIMQRTLCKCLPPQDASDDGWIDEAMFYICELLKQYIKLKIELDLEEIYVCFCLLRRFTTKSEFLLQVYNNVFSHLQASVVETYGGNLHIPLHG